jgi:hypothetical protein
LEYLEELMPKLPFMVYAKICSFFSESMQRVIKNQLLLNNATIPMIASLESGQAS